MAAVGRSFFGKFFGRTVGEGAAFAIGTAVGPTLRPAVQELANLAWSEHPVRPPDAATLAAGVSQGQVDPDQARDWAAQSGFSGTAFDALVSIANIGPGMAQAFNLWRRKQVDEAGFRKALKRLGLEAEWIDALWNVREEILDPAELARAIHRGLVPDPGLLEGELPAREGNVPAYPVYPIDALAEAAGSGIDRDRLGVMVGLQGNPMGAHEAAQAEFRGILTEDDYLRAIAEGNTRNEWAEAIREYSRQIPTARDFLENALRGYRTLDEALEGAARHGMSEEDATLIYQNQGRPMIPRQITQALAWGAHFHPEAGEITDPYEASTVEGNVKPAYYEFYKALRYSLPSAFYFRLLQQQGVITEQQAQVWYRRLGWPPELADQVAHAFAAVGTAKGKAATTAQLLDEYEGRFITQAQLMEQLAVMGYSPEQAQIEANLADARRVKKARDGVIKAVHDSFTGHEIQDADARAYLADDGIPQQAIDLLMAEWTREAAITRKSLTPSQVKKAYAAAILTLDQAVERLVDLGYNDADARALLGS